MIARHTQRVSRAEPRAPLADERLWRAIDALVRALEQGGVLDALDELDLAWLGASSSDRYRVVRALRTAGDQILVAPWAARA